MFPSFPYPRPRHLASPVRAVLFTRLSIVLAAYFLAGRIGLAIPFTSGNVSPVWPPAGIALAAMLVWGYGMWPAILAGAFLVNFFSPVPHAASLGIAVGNTSSALVAAWLVRKTPGFRAALPRLQDVLALVLLGGLSTTIAATVGVTSLNLTGVKPWSGFTSAWLIWWLGDAMGVIVVAPLILSFSRLARLQFESRLEFTGLAAAASGVAFLVFGHRFGLGAADNVLGFLVFPFVIWAAIRFEIAGSAVVSALIAAVAIWETATGLGPFVQPNPIRGATLLQVFLAVISVSGLALAAVIAEREAAQGALHLVQEMTLRRQAEEALIKSEKLASAGRLAATIAHEINNPLAAVTNLLYLARAAEHLPEATRQHLDLADTELQRVAHITKQTLGFYRDQSAPVRFDPAELLDNVLALLQTRIEARNLAVDKRYRAHLQVLGSQGEIRQVFSNVISNGIDALQPGGRLQIKVASSPDWRSPESRGVRVTFADNGHGIAPENLARIFEPFFTTKKNAGTGLGLWVSRQIVDKHAGSIRVRSRTTPHRSGTVFSIFLPLAAASEKRPANPS
ncbi:MAG: MASE1 domain-containing protein [Terriglobales bacterium]